MDKLTHSWIAVRAVALLEDKGSEKNLVALLKPHVQKATVGAWIPDQADAKRGGSRTDNHVLKIEPYSGTLTDRFVMKKNELLKHLGKHRKMEQLIETDASLSEQWWSAPYKGDVKSEGQHLPNRTMALSTMMKDLLLLGNPAIDGLIPGEVKFLKDVSPDMRTTEAAAAMYFFMLSHFIADSCMPCHCDGRLLAGYGKGLHEKLEDHWKDKVGPDFEKNSLGENAVEKARDVDAEFGLAFNNTTVPDLLKGHDVWLEMIYICRASFALDSIIAPPETYPYDDGKARAPFEDVLGDNNKKLLADVDQAVMHDAVLNTAIVWKHIWNKVKKN